MKKHRFDPLSFVFGIMFLAMAGAAVWSDEVNWDIGAWLLPAAVLVLGIGLLASGLRSQSIPPAGEPSPSAGEPSPPVGESSPSGGTGEGEA